MVISHEQLLGGIDECFQWKYPHCSRAGCFKKIPVLRIMRCFHSKLGSDAWCYILSKKQSLNFLLSWRFMNLLKINVWWCCLSYFFLLVVCFFLAVWMIVLRKVFEVAKIARERLSKGYLSLSWSMNTLDFVR